MVDEDYTPAPGKPWAENQLLPAEKKLLAVAKVGGTAEISTLNPTYLVPWVWGKELQIRADLIRHLLIHPDAYQLDPMGFDIKGTIDLQNVKFDLRLGFFQCLFSNPPLLRHARTRSLSFQACRLPGLNADGLWVEGSLFLSKSVCTRNVRLLEVKVDGSVYCTNTIFANKGGTAFNADNISVGGNLHFNGAMITGETRLLGATINGSLECLNATFNNSNNNAWDDALCAQRMCVKAGWIWQLKTPIKGRLDLTQASVSDFVDDGTGWPEKGKLYIDGFRYDNLILPTTAERRIRWLKLMPKIGMDQKPAFYPQPYEQLIKVFKTAGHERDARKIAIAKQDAYRAYLKHQAELNNLTTWHRRLWLLFLKYSAGYGYETWRAGWFVLIFVAFAGMIFNSAYHEGHMAPAKERIYTQSCYTKGVECDKWHTGIKLKWTDQTLSLPEDYPQFTALTYAVDTLIPFVDLHQESYWLPTHLGYKIYLWVHIIFGWVLATIAVAGFTGLIKKD